MAGAIFAVSETLFAYVPLQYGDKSYVVIQVGSTAIKKIWGSYRALKLEATCIIWTLESLYLKGLKKFEL